MQAPSTKVSPISTRMPTLNSFQTHGDPVLTKMRERAEAFVGAMMDKAAPHWISFCGGSGTGKTFLSRLIMQSAPASMTTHRELRNGVMFFSWPHMLCELRAGKYFKEDDFADANLAVMDDIGATRDPSGFAADTLYRCLNRRGSKWTVITSNLTLPMLGDIDIRISSRMIRDRNVCVSSATLDYALRGAKAA